MGRADSPLADRMIFNVGARRSGTYWLQRIVTAHPLVGSVPSETHLFSHGLAPLMERFQHEDRNSAQVGVVFVDRDILLDRLRDLCDAVFSEFARDHRFLAERTALHVLHLPLIAEIYPDARFVHIIRDGRDVARSIAAQDWGSDTIAGAAREWRDAVRAGRAARLPPARYEEVRYEELMARPEEEIARLYAQLGLPAGAAEVARGVAESRREVNVDRFGVGGTGTNKWMRTFTARDLRAFEDEAGDLLEELGYPHLEPEPGSGGRWRPRNRLRRAIAGQWERRRR